MVHHKVIYPGAFVLMLGDGQLARMTALDGARLGYRFVTIGLGGRESPAGHVVYEAHTCEPGFVVSDELLGVALVDVEVALCEFENVPADLIRRIEQRGVPVCASSRILEIAQNRVFEKNFAQGSGVSVVPYREVRKATGTLAKKPSILKTCSNGYDGRSQERLESGASVDEAWYKLGQVPCVLEERIEFKKEISVIVARSGRGQMAVYGPFENEHQGGILRTTTYPASIDSKVADEAWRSTIKIACDLGLQGILCVEYFLTHSDRLLFNEMAARPHNSGHITQRVCDVSQFEAYVRAACNLSIDPANFHTHGVMMNLIGSDMQHWMREVGKPGHHVHHYGKDGMKEGRKLGHVIIPEGYSR